MTTARWRELTKPVHGPVTLADAKAALRVVDFTDTPATKANLVVGTGNSRLVFIAKVPGALGNSYSVQILTSGINTALSVTFTGSVLTINLATNGSGTATSIAADVKTALEANSYISNIFEITNGTGNGSGVVAALEKTYLNSGADSGDEESYITFLIQAAAEVVEEYTGQILIQRTFRMFMDEWADEDDSCESDEIIFPIGPVISVEAVKYYDSLNTLQTLTGMILDSEDYLIPARLKLPYGTNFPVLRITEINSVYVDFTAGHGTISTEVPARIRQCVLFLVGHWYANREPVISGISVLSNKIPFTFETTLNSFRLMTV